MYFPINCPDDLQELTIKVKDFNCNVIKEITLKSGESFTESQYNEFLEENKNSSKPFTLDEWLIIKDKLIEWYECDMVLFNFIETNGTVEVWKMRGGKMYQPNWWSIVDLNALLNKCD